MFRIGLLAFALAAWAMLSNAARAQEGLPETDDNRFSLFRTDDGYLRLDSRTGQVSICTSRQSRWLCEVVPDERAALEAEMARLQRDNATLKSEVLAHHLPLPSGLRPQALPAANPLPRGEANQGLDRFRNAIHGVWRRLVALIVSVQRDLLKPS
jgi:hypothetical protein